MWVLSLDTLCWSAPTLRGEVPPMREGQGVALLKDTVYVFGGTDRVRVGRQVTFSATHGGHGPHCSVAINSVPCILPPLAHPARCASSSSCHDLCLHPLRMQATRFGDLFALSLLTRTWRRVHHSSGPWPCARDSPGMATLPAPHAGDQPDRFAVFGGGDSATVYNDVWVFSTNSNSWAKAEVCGCAPPCCCSILTLTHAHTHAHCRSGAAARLPGHACPWSPPPRVCCSMAAPLPTSSASTTTPGSCARWGTGKVAAACGECLLCFGPPNPPSHTHTHTHTQKSHVGHALPAAAHRPLASFGPPSTVAMRE
jgi:hypothetical protein